MFEQYPSRSGSISASYRGKQLHSSFNPEREAERYIQTELPQIPRTVILIGPGLGYLIRAIINVRPDCRVVSMFLSPECHRNAVATGEAAWPPACGTDPADFLSATLDELESAALTALEWPPATSCFASEAEKVREAVTAVIRQHQASLLTEGANGKRWLANVVRNFPAITDPVTPQPDDTTPVKACVIAAAGPSLEGSLAAIAAMRGEVSLWVLGSALGPVLARGLEPDLLISTDAAVYASEYLREAIVHDGFGIPIAAPLTASRGIGDNTPIWPLSQNDPVELMLYEQLSARPTPVPAHGTVAGTALQLALALQEWPVVIAGMDLAWHGLQSHARPHVAQVYRDLAGTRLTPPVTALYGQSRHMVDLENGWATNDSLLVYARWFDRVVGGPGQRVYRLGPSPISTSIQVMEPQVLSALPRHFHAPAFVPLTWPERPRREQMVRKVIDHCRRALELLAESAVPAPPEPLQLFLLRRLALDRLLRWNRTDSPAELRGGAAAALEALSQLGDGAQ